MTSDTLHHRGNGLTADSQHLQRYLALADSLLRFLFGDAAMDAAVMELQEATSVETEAPPALVAEIDEMIRRIRARVDATPAGAPLRAAIPAADLWNLLERIESVTVDLGSELTQEALDELADYDDWSWQIDGPPDDPEDAIAELERLRYLVLMALL